MLKYRKFISLTNDEIELIVKDMFHPESINYIEKDKISLEYKIEHINTKYSRSDKINKRYRHAFYEVKISKFTDELKKQKFSVDGTRYQWMTLDQMWNDKAIKDCNTDIVGYVRDIYQ